MGLFSWFRGKPQTPVGPALPTVRYEYDFVNQRILVFFDLPDIMSSEEANGMANMLLAIQTGRLAQTTLNTLKMLASHSTSGGRRVVAAHIAGGLENGLNQEFGDQPVIKPVDAFRSN